MCRYVLASCLMLCFLYNPQTVWADDEGNFEKVSSKSLEKQVKNMEGSINFSQSQADGWAKKLDEIKAEEQKEQKIKDELTKNKDKLEKCTNGSSKCSGPLIEKLKEKITDAEEFIANSDDNGRRNYQKAQYERNMNYHVQEAAKAKAKLEAAKQEIEKRKAPVVTPPPVEEEAEPEEVDGVLPPAAAAEPAKAEVPKQEEIIGMASPAKAAKTADTATNVTADTGAKKTTTTSSSSSSNALFGTLTQKAAEVFTGLREIIFAVAGFGITAVAIGGFFGNLNWKWLSAIIIGLVVISTTSAIINYMVDSDAITGEMITDTLISAR